MSEIAQTRPSLLLRIRDSNDSEAWGQFVELYAPLVFRYARRRGMQEADAADLAQEVLWEVAGAIEKLNYDPQIGRFRSWLYKVTQYRLSQWFKRQVRAAVGSGDSKSQLSLEQIVDENSNDNDDWDVDYQRQLFQWAAARVKNQFRQSTWMAFWLTAVEGRSPQSVASELKTSVGAVYIARNRVTGRLKQVIQEIDDIS